MPEADSSMPPQMLDGSGRPGGFDPAPLAETEAAGSAAELRLRLAECARLLSAAERDGELRANEAASLRAQADERERLATALALVQGERDALVQSTSWRLTAPLRALTEQLRGLRPGAPRPAANGAESSGPQRNLGLDDALTPRAFREPAPAGPARVTVVVDSFGTALSGGAGLAVTIAAAMAMRQGAPLRILSRRTQRATDALDQVLAGRGLSFDANPSFDWLALDGRGPMVGVTDTERFVTGTRDDTRLALTLAEPARVVYVVDRQEVAALISGERERPAPDLCPPTQAVLVYQDAQVRDALRDAGLLNRRDPRAPALLLPAAPAAGDWPGIADRLLGAAEPA